MKKGMLFMAIFSFAVIFELLSVSSALAADTTVSNSLSAKYYSIPVMTDDLTNLAPSDSGLLSPGNMILETKDMISMFDLPQTDERRFPDFDSLPGDPKYFAAHWSGSIIVPKDGDYRVTLSSHEASQLFINGVQIISVSPNDQLGGMSITMHLSEGASNVDIYFAKRSDFQSGLIFKIDGVKFTSSYQENMPTASIVSTNVVESSAPIVNEVAIQKSANNVPRVVHFNPPRTAKADTYFAYKVLAEDTDGSSLSYKLLDAPQGMTIVPSTGLILWKPLSNQVVAKPYSVLVQVSDGIDSTISRFEISVKIPVTNSALSQNKINSQISGSLTNEPVRTISAKNISVNDAREKETSAPAGSRLSASVLFTGVFIIGHWLKARFQSFIYFFASMVFTGLIVYVFLEMIDRKKQNKNNNHFYHSTDAMPKNQMTSQTENA